MNSSMQKLCSNGGQFQTIFSPHLKRLVLLYSTSSSSSMVDYMVNSLGFSRGEAITTCKKVRALRIRKLGKPELVVDFLRLRGFDNTQIKKIVSSMPDLLLSRVAKTLEPKFNALEKLGIFGSDLAGIIASNPSIIRRGLTTKITPMISFMKSIVGDNENFFKVLRRSYWLMSTDVATILQPNMELFRKYGLTDEKIQKLFVSHAELFGRDPKMLQTILVKVEDELGIPRTSSSFTSAAVLLASYSETTIASKLQVYKRFGWSESDVSIMMRKAPRCLVLSETEIANKLNFFMNELGCEPGFLASRSYVLTYSMEARVLPRYTIMKGLKERKLIRTELGILAVVCTSEPRFLEQYVLPYKDELPELCEGYICRKK